MSSAPDNRPPETAAAFWETAEARRNVFIAVGVGWLVAGLPLWWLVRGLIPGANPMMSGLIALLLWGMLWWWTGQRVTEMRCFACGNRAFPTPWFTLANVRCMACGVRPARRSD